MGSRGHYGSLYLLFIVQTIQAELVYKNLIYYIVRRMGG